MTDVRRPEESFWIRFNEHLLRALGRRAPGAEPVVVVVVRGGDELLAGDKPRRFTVAELLGHLGQAQAELSQLLDLGRVTGRAIGAQSAWRDGDDDVALLVTQVDVAMRLDNFVQRKATVDHRPKRAALGEFLQHQQV